MGSHEEKLIEEKSLALHACGIKDVEVDRLRADNAALKQLAQEWEEKYMQAGSIAENHRDENTILRADIVTLRETIIQQADWGRCREEYQAEIVALLAVNRRLADDHAKMSCVREVWERFKHLDILLSDESWMKEKGHPMTPQRHCLFDLWKAIKEANA